MVTNKTQSMLWGRRELVPLAFIALILTARFWAGFIPGVSSNVYVSVALSVFLQTAATVCVCIAYRDMLGEMWAKYKSRVWLKILFAAACAAAMYLILGAARMLPFVAEASAARGGGGEPQEIAPWFAVFAALVPLQAPFLEEVLFRHNLFFRFRKNVPLAAATCAVSAVLFGAAHINNFGGSLILTVPYMLVGLFLNLVYVFTKNIWYTLIPHIIFNALGGILPALLLLALSALGVDAG